MPRDRHETEGVGDSQWTVTSDMVRRRRKIRTMSDWKGSREAAAVAMTGSSLDAGCCPQLTSEGTERESGQGTSRTARFCTQGTWA